ncbi:FAD binding domain-containing protein [Calidifontibacillus oryziterrae]|uniref:FAD binding domain-containing protein n=1 Tax=Calidifontibacillus oryziterrae TaxID=1191699 RepID=UPI0002F6A15D|nr:xanthine dehydrogenase family protein subunit M [Calidifontibacillus oryziterrae]
MIATSFEYVRAATITEAIELLKNNDGEGKLIAGGHSLVPLMKFHLTTPTTLIDISRINELKGVKKDGKRIVIGAATTYADVINDETIAKHLPVLKDAIKQIGDMQIRNKGTIGGNIAHADPSADLPAIALALDAIVHLNGENGEEQVAIQEFLLGPFMTNLPATSIITSISFVIPQGEGKSTYIKFPHPASGYAVVGVCAVASKKEDGTVDNVRIGITGAGESAFRAESVERFLLGKEATLENISNAASLAASDGEMGEDLFASRKYREALCKVYTERALKQVLS